MAKKTKKYKCRADEKHLLIALKMKGFTPADILYLSTLIHSSPKFVEYFKIILRKENERSRTI